MISFCQLEWTQIGSDIVGEAEGDEFGVSVAISEDGTTIVSGGFLNDDSGTDAGHVRVFDWDGDAWNQRGIDIDGEAAEDLFGTSVAIDENKNTIVVGAVGNDGSDSYAGHVRVFDWDGTNWVQRGTDIDGETINGRFGFSVSISGDGNTFAAGAFLNNEIDFNAGHVQVFDWTGTDWSQRGLDIDGKAANDRFGKSLAISKDGNTIVSGGNFNDETGLGGGNVRIFDWEGTIWSQRGANINGEAVEDEFGSSVAISENGNTIAVGGRFNDGTGPNAGHVRVLDWDGTNWNQRGIDIDGEAANDQFGTSIAMSWDGNVIVVGARFNDGSAADAGHVRAFYWNGTRVGFKKD